MATHLYTNHLNLKIDTTPANRRKLMMKLDIFGLFFFPAHSHLPAETEIQGDQLITRIHTLMTQHLLQYGVQYVAEGHLDIDLKSRDMN